MIKRFGFCRQTAVYAILALLTVLAFSSCNEGETYGDKKEKERDAIRAFIAEHGINVISEEQFNAQECTTDTAENEFVYLEKSGVYMQIVCKGEGEKLEDNKRTNLLIRFFEQNIQNENVVQNLYSTSSNSKPMYDKMTVVKNGVTYTASFVSGTMYNNYGGSVPTGWLPVLDYINLGRPTSNDAIATVNLIVPHTKGQASASSNVYPCYYFITFEREK